MATNEDTLLFVVESESDMCCEDSTCYTFSKCVCYFLLNKWIGSLCLATGTEGHPELIATDLEMRRELLPEPRSLRYSRRLLIGTTDGSVNGLCI
jgi:hypothetical protein